MRGKIIIAGTGRAGTSFLVRLLTRLDIDTGWNRNVDGFIPSIRAGCEIQWGSDHHNIPPSPEWLETAPRIIKSPYLSRHLTALVEQGTKIDHVIIPIRDLDDATNSRLNAGLSWFSEDFEEEKRNLTETLAKCTNDCDMFQIPRTFLRFPQHVKDVDYAFVEMAKVFPELDRERFVAEFDQLNRERL